MNTYEILFNGEITKVRSKAPAYAVATVAFKYSVSNNDVRNNGKIRVITKSFVSDFNQIF